MIDKIVHDYSDQRMSASLTCAVAIVMTGSGVGFAGATNVSTA